MTKINRLEANGGICAHAGCENKRISPYHSYCLEHIRAYRNEWFRKNQSVEENRSARNARIRELRRNKDTQP